MPNIEHHRLVEDLFHNALDLGPGFLDSACAGEDSLRAEVESLLESYRQWSAALPAAPEAPLPRFGPYACDSILGTGGMGTVYRAHRDDGQFAQHVAVKVLRGSLHSEWYRQRFLAERQILARLNHPHIARLLDGGMTPDGEPYLVMELVDGDPIDAYCAKLRLTIDKRIGLFEQVLQAVDYAHRNLVVHRDLKPSNILVTSDGNVKLLDFGTSKLMEEESTATSLHALTPRYASPEQLRGEPVTTSTDVYSLGVVLYELLAGSTPFEENGLLAVMARATGSKDPIPLPDQLTDGAALERGRSLAQLRQELRGDLASIVGKALSAAPKGRYASPLELGEDIKRYLERRPITARRQTIAYSVGKLLRRRWLAASAAVIFIVGLVLAGVFSQIQLRKAQAEAEKSKAISKFLQDMIEESHPLTNSRHDLTLKEAVNEAANRLNDAKSLGPLTEAELRLSFAISFLGQLDYQKMQFQLDRADALFQSAGSREGHTKVVFWRSSSFMQTGKRKEARQGFMEVVTLCRELGDAAPADIWLGSLVAVLNYYGLSFAETDKLIAEGDALIKKRPDLDLANIAAFESSKGRVSVSHKHWDEAESHFQESLRLVRKLPRHEATSVALPLMELGYLRVRKNDFPKAEEHARAAMKEYSDMSGPDSAYTSSVAGEVALYLAHQGKLEEARRIADYACQKTEGGVLYQRYKQLFAAAVVRNETGDGEGSLPFAEQAFASSATDPKTSRSYAESLGEVGIALALQGRLKEGLPKMEEAAKTLASTLDPQHPFTLRMQRHIANLGNTK